MEAYLLQKVARMERPEKKEERSERTKMMLEIQLGFVCVGGGGVWNGGEAGRLSIAFIDTYKDRLIS